MVIFGIDVSKNHLDIFSINEEKIIIQKKIKNSFSAICKFLLTIPQGSLICAEYTAIYSDMLAFTTFQNGSKMALIEGYTLKHSMGNPKGKSDKIDAKRIWEYAVRFQDKLKYYIPEQTNICELNQLFNLRKQLVRQKKSLQVEQTAINSKVAYSIECHQIRKSMLTELDKQIENIETQLLMLIEQDQQLSKNLSLITSVDGVGNITAIELIIVTGNFKKIDAPRKAAAYAGICPYLNESGSVINKARISARGDKSLKSLLFMCSMYVSVHNKDFVRYKEKKAAEGKNYFLIMNNVANKLLRTIYAVVNSGKPFDKNYISIDPRIAA